MGVIAQRVQYYDADGKLVTESFKDYTRKTLLKEYASLDDFTRKWQDADRKEAIIHELEQQGIIWEVLAEEVGKDLDPFDMLCHVVYGQPPLTRKERAENVRKRNYFTKYSEAAQAVLDNLLDKYADAGVQEIESIQVLKLKPFDSMGTLPEIIKTGFGDRNGYNQALSELENEIYHHRPALLNNFAPSATIMLQKALFFMEYNMSISSVIKSLQDIMRKDAGVDGDAQRLGQLSWLLF